MPQKRLQFAPKKYCVERSKLEYWERGRPRPHRSHAQFLRIWRFNRSRFALIGGPRAAALQVMERAHVSTQDLEYSIFLGTGQGF
jgi:hypothetical protein